MTHDNSEKTGKRYTLRPTFTPLPHASDDEKKASTDSGASKEAAAQGTAVSKSDAGTTKAAASVIRAANEDDDLYDPYSDFHDGTLKAAEFEEDPWR